MAGKNSAEKWRESISNADRISEDKFDQFLGEYMKYFNENPEFAECNASLAKLHSHLIILREAKTEKEYKGALDNVNHEYYKFEKLLANVVSKYGNIEELDIQLRGLLYFIKAKLDIYKNGPTQREKITESMALTENFVLRETFKSGGYKLVKNVAVHLDSDSAYVLHGGVDRGVHDKKKKRPSEWYTDKFDAAKLFLELYNNGYVDVDSKFFKKGSEKEKAILDLIKKIADMGSLPSSEVEKFLETNELYTSDGAYNVLLAFQRAIASVDQVFWDNKNFDNGLIRGVKLEYGSSAKSELERYTRLGQLEEEEVAPAAPPVQKPPVPVKEPPVPAAPVQKPKPVPPTPPADTDKVKSGTVQLKKHEATPVKSKLEGGETVHVHPRESLDEDLEMKFDVNREVEALDKVRKELWDKDGNLKPLPEDEQSAPAAPAPKPAEPVAPPPEPPTPAPAPTPPEPQPAVPVEKFDPVAVAKALKDDPLKLEVEGIEFKISVVYHKHSNQYVLLCYTPSFTKFYYPKKYEYENADTISLDALKGDINKNIDDIKAYIESNLTPEMIFAKNMEPLKESFNKSNYTTNVEGIGEVKINLIAYAHSNEYGVYYVPLASEYKNINYKSEKYEIKDAHKHPSVEALKRKIESDMDLIIKPDIKATLPALKKLEPVPTAPAPVVAPPAPTEALTKSAGSAEKLRNWGYDEEFFDDLRKNIDNYVSRNSKDHSVRFSSAGPTRGLEDIDGVLIELEKSVPEEGINITSEILFTPEAFHKDQQAGGDLLGNALSYMVHGKARKIQITLKGYEHEVNVYERALPIKLHTDQNLLEVVDSSPFEAKDTLIPYPSLAGTPVLEAINRISTKYEAVPTVSDPWGSADYITAFRPIGLPASQGGDKLLIKIKKGSEYGSLVYVEATGNVSIGGGWDETAIINKDDRNKRIIIEESGNNNVWIVELKRNRFDHGSNSYKAYTE